MSRDELKEVSDCLWLPLLSFSITYTSVNSPNERIDSLKLLYVYRSSSDSLRVFTIWWSTGLSKEEQRPFRQLQHRGEKTRIQAHSQRSFVFRMDDSWWDALFGENEGKLK